MRRLLKSFGVSAIAAVAAFPLVLALFMAPGTDNYKPIAHAQFGGNIPLDTQLCNTVGAIAVRQPTRWQCVAPGTNQQVFVSNGAGAVPGWTTPAGTGNVNASGTPTANQVPFWVSATTIKGVAAGGTALDGVNGASTTGYEKRTGAGVYTWAAIPSADVPAFTGPDCSSLAGSGAISCAAMLGNAHTFTQSQSVSGTDLFYYANNPTSGHSAGFAAEYNGQIVTEMLGLAPSTSLLDFTGQLIFRAIDQSYASQMTLSNTGVLAPKTLQPTNPVAVAYGGTNCTAAGGACLDNILAPGGVGIMFRNSANTYTFNTLSALIDNYASNAQGSILYRGASGWASLAPASSAGQVLSSNGTGANPAWVAPGTVTPGTRVLLNTMTASSSATLDDTTSISSTYAEYEIDCNRLAPSATAGLQFLVYQSGSLVTSGYVGGVSQTSPTTTSTAGTSDTADLALSNLNITTSGDGYTGQLRFSNPQATAITEFYGTGSGNGGLLLYNHAGHAPSGATSGFRFKFSTGNIVSGTCKVYGGN